MYIFTLVAFNAVLWLQFATFFSYGFFSLSQDTIYSVVCWICLIRYACALPSHITDIDCFKTVDACVRVQTISRWEKSVCARKWIILMLLNCVHNEHVMKQYRKHNGIYKISWDHLHHFMFSRLHFVFTFGITELEMDDFFSLSLFWKLSFIEEKYFMLISVETE